MPPTVEVHECETAELAEAVAADVVARRATAIIYSPHVVLGDSLPIVPGTWIVYHDGQELGTDHHRQPAHAMAVAAAEGPESQTCEHCRYFDGPSEVQRQTGTCRYVELGRGAVLAYLSHSNETELRVLRAFGCRAWRPKRKQATVEAH